jgi:hypothetical protein
MKLVFLAIIASGVTIVFGSNRHSSSIDLKGSSTKVMNGKVASSVKSVDEERKKLKRRENSHLRNVRLEKYFGKLSIEDKEIVKNAYSRSQSYSSQPSTDSTKTYVNTSQAGALGQSRYGYRRGYGYRLEKDEDEIPLGLIYSRKETVYSQKEKKQADDSDDEPLVNRLAQLRAKRNETRK